MNSGLSQLLEMSSKIELDGWIVIPPQPNINELNIRVEWFIGGEKYGFQYTFSIMELNICNTDLFSEFIIAANKGIEKLLLSNNK